MTPEQRDTSNKLTSFVLASICRGPDCILIEIQIYNCFVRAAHNRPTEKCSTKGFLSKQQKPSKPLEMTRKAVRKDDNKRENYTFTATEHEFICLLLSALVSCFSVVCVSLVLYAAHARKRRVH